MIANQRATTLVNESMGIQKGYVNSSLIIYGNHIYSMSSYNDKESFLSENKVSLIVSGGVGGTLCLSKVKAPLPKNPKLILK